MNNWIIISVLAVTLIAFNFAYADLPDTGQTTCYDNTNVIPCPQSGEPFYGQDANYLINLPQYIKLDAMVTSCLLPQLHGLWFSILLPD